MSASRASGPIAAVVLLAVVASGCGGDSKKVPESPTSRRGAEQSHISALSLKCRESKPAVAAQLDAALQTLRDHGLGGPRAQLAEDFDKVATYVGEREKAVDCNALSAALVATIEEKAK